MQATIILTTCLLMITLIIVSGAFANKVNASFPITLTDDIGRTISIISVPKRMVCISC